MFKKIIKDRQLVDIVKTRHGAYLTVNFRDNNYPISPSLYKEPFKIKGNENLIDLVHMAVKKNPKYEIKCCFDSPFKTNIIETSKLSDYIFKLKNIIDTEFKNYRKIIPKEKNKNNKDIYNQIKNWYYEKTFQKILRKNIKNSFDTDFFPHEISITNNGKILNVIGRGMDDIFGYGNAKIDIYELIKIMPRKRIFSTKTYAAKKINSGFIHRIGTDFGLYSKQTIKEMKKDCRYIDFRGFPSYINFDSELNVIDPLIIEMRKFKK